MKNLLLLFCCAFLALQLPAQGIEFFHGSWEEALAEAKKQDKLIFVDAYTTWCGPCKAMAANTFPDENVGREFNRNFINVKLDMEKPESVTFRQQHPVRAYPTLFFVNGDDEAVHTVVGGQRPEQLLSQATAALAKLDDLDAYREKYAGGDRSPEFMYTYVRGLIRAGEPHLKVANDYVRDHADRLDSEGGLRFLLLTATEADSRLFKLLSERRAAALALVGEEDFDRITAAAARTTVQKAIEFKDEDLLERGLKAYTAVAEPQRAARYELTSEMDFAAATRDAKSFLKAGKKYKKLISGRAEELTAFFTTLAAAPFGKVEKVTALTVEVGEESAEATNTFRQWYTYADYLQKSGNKAAAMAAAERALVLAKEEGPNQERLAKYMIMQLKG